MYHNEGQGSPAGSVGCCSLLESDDDLQFLNDLGLKFKTLADICSPPTPPTSKPSLTSKVGGVVKTTAHKSVVRPSSEHIVEIKRTDTKTDKAISGNISKSTVTTLNTATASNVSHTLPHSKVTNISHSSNMIRSATIPHPAQAVLVQQQPMYYTANTVLQPMHYVVQPQLQNTVLLADGARGANFQGLYMVSGTPGSPTGMLFTGPQSSPPGLVISGIESRKSPTSTASLTSPVSPTLFLPGSPGMSPGSIPVGGWKIVGPNSDGNYMLVKDQTSSDEAEGLEPDSSQGTLPRGGILVKEAAPPQRVLSPAAQGHVHGILPGHIVINRGDVVAENRNLGQGCVGEPRQIGLGSVTVMGASAEQAGRGHAAAVKPKVTQPRIRPSGMNTVGSRHDKGRNPLEQIGRGKEILMGSRQHLPKNDKTFLNAKSTQTRQSSHEHVTMKKLFKNCELGQKSHEDDIVDKISLISEHETKLDIKDPSEVVQGALERNETKEENVVVKVKEDILKSLPVPDVPLTTFEQSEKPEEKNLYLTMNENISDQLITIPEMSNVTLIDVESQREPTDFQHNAGEAEAQTVAHTSTIVASVPGSDVKDLVHTDREEVTMCFSDYTTNQINDNRGQTGGRQETGILGREGQTGLFSIVESPRDRGPETELSKSEYEQDEEFSPAEMLKSDLETKSLIFDATSVQTEDNNEEMPDCHADLMTEQEQLLVSKLEINDAGNILSASPPNKSTIDPLCDSEERSIPDLEAKAEVQQEENRDQCDQDLIPASDEITDDGGTEEEADGSYLQSDPALAQQPYTTEVNRCDFKQKATTQQDVISENNQNQVIASDNISNGVKERCIGEEAASFIPHDIDLEDATHTSCLVDHQLITDEDKQDGQKEEDMVDEPASVIQQHFSISDDHDESQEDESEDSSHRGSDPLQQNLHISNDKDEEGDKEDASGTGSQEEDQLTSSDTENNGKKEGSIHQGALKKQNNFSISYDKDEETEIANACETSSQLEDRFGAEQETKKEVSSTGFPEEDQLIFVDINEGEKDEGKGEEVASLVQPNLGNSDTQDEEIAHTHGTCSQKEDQLTSNEKISDEESMVEEVELHMEQHFTITNDHNEEDASVKHSHVDDHLLSDTDEKKIKEDASCMSSEMQVDSSNSYQLVEDNSHSVETEYVSEEDPHSAGQQELGATSQLVERIEKSCDLRQVEDKNADVPEKQATIGQELRRHADMESLDHVVKSSEELTSSKVATGQISSSSVDKVIGNLSALGEVVECTHTFECVHGEDEGEDFTLEGDKAEVSFDQEIRDLPDVLLAIPSTQEELGGSDCLSNATPQASQGVYLDTKVVDQTTLLMLQSGSVQTGAMSATAVSGVSEEAAYLSHIQGTSVELPGEAARGNPEAVGKGASATGGLAEEEVVSEVSDYTHSAEAGGSQVSPAQLQTGISQTPRNQNRKSKRDSSKTPKSPKSPSGKCKQQ